MIVTVTLGSFIESPRRVTPSLVQRACPFFSTPSSRPVSRSPSRIWPILVTPPLVLIAATPGTRLQTLANATSSEWLTYGLYDRKCFSSCRWWRGGQGGGHYLLFFEAPSVARLETQLQFRSDDPVLPEPRNALQKSMDQWRLLVTK